MPVAEQRDGGLEFHKLGASADLVSILQLRSPPFVTPVDAFRQLHYLDNYVRRPELSIDGSEERSVLIEKHYIDRDYMEDHGAFYAKNAFPYKNHCRRVHFFSMAVDPLRQLLSEMVAAVASGDEETRGLLHRRVEQQYLGFTVVKPLEGTPVGRTVLRPVRSVALAETSRVFPCTRAYSVHVHGVELTVEGLAFQQQDVGVSACATTALWSALHKTQELEHVSLPTPAQITALASRFSLPFGRPMPSEGLSLDQMCQAVHALGLAPDLIPVSSRSWLARVVIHTAVMSGFAPVLVLRYPDRTAHAVCVVGEELRASSSSIAKRNYPLAKEVEYSAEADDLVGLYFHDDRFGPYLSGNFVDDGGDPHLVFQTVNSRGSHEHRPAITHLIIPVHAKIRLSFLGLTDIAIHLLKAMADIGKKEGGATTMKWYSANPPRLQTRIQKGPRYLQSLLRSTRPSQPDHVVEEWSKLHVPRYCGVVRISAAGEHLDVVVDCTSTRRNPHFVATISRPGTIAHVVGEDLAKTINCPSIAIR